MKIAKVREVCFVYNVQNSKFIDVQLFECFADFQPVIFNNWDVGFPQNEGSNKCGVMITTWHHELKKGRWQNRRCDLRKRGLCKLTACKLYINNIICVIN